MNIIKFWTLTLWDRNTNYYTNKIFKIYIYGLTYDVSPAARRGRDFVPQIYGPWPVWLPRRSIRKILKRSIALYLAFLSSVQLAKNVDITLLETIYILGEYLRLFRVILLLKMNFLGCILKRNILLIESFMNS